jgi:hypothetical protein
MTAGYQGFVLPAPTYKTDEGFVRPTTEWSNKEQAQIMNP